MTAHSEVLPGSVPRVRPSVRARRSLISAHTRELLAMVATVALLVGALLSYVFQHIQVVRLSYEVAGLRRERATLLDQEKALTLEAGRLRAVKRVEEVARGRLGMGMPAPGQVTVVR